MDIFRFIIIYKNIADKVNAIYSATYGQVKEKIDNIENNVDDIGNKYIENIYVGSDGKLHKVQGGADSVLPFNSGSKIIRLGSNASYNVSSYAGYTKFTKNNFLVEFSSLPYTQCSDNDGRGGGGLTKAYGCSLTKSYNSSTGVFTVSGLSQTVEGANSDNKWTTTQNVNFVIYLVP